MPEIWLRKSSHQVIFANSNLPENRYHICKTEEKDDDTNVFIRHMLDWYMNRPNTTFKNGNFAALDTLCYAEFLCYYTLDTKKE